MILSECDLMVEIKMVCAVHDKFTHDDLMKQTGKWSAQNKYGLRLENELQTRTQRASDGILTSDLKINPSKTVLLNI